MPYSIRRWSEDDVAKLRRMAQKYSTAAIAAQLGRSAAATIVKEHELKLSLRVQPPNRRLVRSGVLPVSSCRIEAALKCRSLWSGASPGEDR